MNVPNKTVSKETMQAEWLEIQAAQRDASLFRPLYNRYFEMIFRFIYRRTAKEALAADICSQVFLKAMQKLPSYQFKGVPFSAWLYRIASNEITQHFRNVQKNRVVSIDDFSFMDILSEIEGKDSVDYRGALIAALDQLKASDLQLIELRFFEQRPFKEIAAILTITESNAKVKTYRILEKLKKIILTTGRPSSD
ncbi:MAG: RNA polymerase sigma factor [Saprospiraceae bacterium]